jgi:hypothetical protein
LTLNYFGPMVFGISSDTKPANQPNDKTIFIETDTGKIYIKTAGIYRRVLL